jgi:hypothetical protein
VSEIPNHLRRRPHGRTDRTVHRSTVSRHCTSGTRPANSFRQSVSCRSRPPHTRRTRDGASAAARNGSDRMLPRRRQARPVASGELRRLHRRRNGAGSATASGACSQKRPRSQPGPRSRQLTDRLGDVRWAAPHHANGPPQTCTSERRGVRFAAFWKSCIVAWSRGPASVCADAFRRPTWKR